MNKLFTKIAGLSLGLAMAIGVGVAVGSNSKEATPVHAATNTVSFVAGTDKGSTTGTGADSVTKSGIEISSTSAAFGRNDEYRLYASSTTTFTSSVGNITEIYFKSGSSLGNIALKSGESGTYNSSTKKWSGSATSVKFTHSAQAKPTAIDVTHNVAATYTVTIGVGQSGYGTVTQSSVTNVTSGTTVSTNGNKVTVGSTTVTANPAAQTAQYTYAFSSWSNVPSTVTENVTITANFTRTTRTYNVTGNITKGTLSVPGQISYGGSLDVTLVPTSGYGYPESSSDITVSGATISAYNNTTGVISLSSATGAVTVTATCPALGNTYTITTTVSGGTYSGDTSITDNGGVASVTIAPTGDYKLPASVSVSGADHTYNASTGAISLSNATGNVTISAAMVALTEYTITVNETNGSHTGASTIKESRTASLTFEPDPGYGQPASVTVTGATYTWTRGTGVLSLSNPTGNVTVTYAAAGNELTSITLGTQKTAYVLGEDFSMPVVTAHYSVADDKVVTGSATESGYDPYSIGNKSITISYTEGGITQTSSYSVTVSAKKIETTTTWTRVTSAATLKAGGTFILGYEATANSGVIIPMANTGSATTSTAGFMYSGSTASSGGTGTINMSTLGDNGSDFEIAVGASSAVNDAIYLKVGDNYIGNQDTKNNCKLFAEQSATTSFGVSVGSNDVLTLTIAANSSYTTLQYNSGSPRFAVYGGTQKNLVAYQKVTESSGSASLIRIVCDPSIDAETGYKGGAKFVGDPVYTSDFVVKKQLDTGNALTAITDFTINGGTEVELTSTSNNIVVSYTEGGITKNTTVVVEATQRAAELESVELVEQGTVKKSGYIDYPSATWNLDNIYVHYYWSDEEFDTEVTLASLVATHDATLSPAKPIVGETSFSVSYEYLEVQITNNTITLTEAVKADYVTSISWTGTSASQFKAYSGGQLTAQQVAAWTVVPTFAGAGEQSALSFGDYVLKVGTKTISSLPYTWTSEDDGQELSITYGKDVYGHDFVKKNATAVGNICATINAIDHDETTTGEQTITLDVANATFNPSGTSGTGSEATATINGFTITTDKGYHDSGTSLRVYKDGSFEISSSYQMTAVAYTTAASDKGGLSDEEFAATTTYSTTATAQARIATITITYNGTVTTTTHYANDMDHFDAQKAVVTFAKFMNTTMNGTNVCSGTFANLESAWGTVADKYDELFGESTTLDATELAWAKNMLKYATASWASELEPACVERAMKTYEFCITNHSGVCNAFMVGVRSVSSININPLQTSVKNSSTAIAIIAISAVSLAAIGGYFLFRKKKEN